MQRLLDDSNWSSSSESDPLMPNVSIEVNDQLKETLLQFTIVYLVEQPSDIIDFAVDFFKRMQSYRTQTGGRRTQEFEDETQAAEPLSQSFLLRRHSVFAEAYDPAKDVNTLKIVHPKTDEQRERLNNAVESVLLFRSLQRDQISILMDAMFERSVKKGEYVITQGMDGDNFYVIEKGEFQVIKNGEHVHSYKDAGVFGELALMYNQPRAASVLAITDGFLWALDRTTFRRIVLKTAYQQREMYNSLLNNVPMMQMVPQYERMNLADALVSKHYAQDEPIIKIGDEADGMYFVEDGEVIIKRLNQGIEIEVARLRRGEYFGELSLLTRQPRLASAYASTDAKLAFLDKNSFERVLSFMQDVIYGNLMLYEKKWNVLLGNME